MIDGSFQSQYRIGLEGEELVLKYLKQSHNIKDVRLNKYYQDKDIDFIVDGVSLEIKTDKNISKTGNIYLETRNDGWFNKCRAEYLGIYSPQLKTVFIFKYDMLKSLIPFGKEISHFDYDTYLETTATLVPLFVAENKGALTQKIKL